jgi:hypothetical protein
MQNNKSNILLELLQKQLKDVCSDKKLTYNDLKRITKYIDTSLFDNTCTMWTGYITSIKHDKKNSYINFFFKKKKYALHRLLYSNYIGELYDSEYIKFSCPNKGVCCNIKHFYKNKKPIKFENLIDTVQDEKKVLDNIIVNF